MMRWPKSRACPGAISISSTIIFSATGASPGRCSTGCVGQTRLFQAAATVDSILRGDLIERAEAAGLRSLFVGFESLTPANLVSSNKRQNLGHDYKAVTDRLHHLGIMINGSFVFGMDDDEEDVFSERWIGRSSTASRRRPSTYRHRIHERDCSRRWRSKAAS
jgi:hypothetical protein